MSASQQGNMDIVEILVKHGANVDVKSKVSNYYAVCA